MLAWACGFGRHAPLDESAAGEIPGLKMEASIGVPSHGLRTRAADYMRRNNPEIAARIIPTHLGHGTLEAGEEYSAECKSEAAVRAWQKDWQRIAKAG
jgi:hypothetical protein